jgi:hypothetical protein
MALFKVVLQSGAFTTLGGNNAMIVEADNAADAKAAAMNHSDDDAAPWDQATATEITPDAALAGLRIEVRITADDDNGFEDDVVVSYDVPEGASADTVDEVGALLVAALNAHADLASVTYTAGSDTVTIVAANNVGLSEISAKVYASGAAGEYEVTGMAPTVSAVGSAAAEDRTIVLTPLGNGRPAVITGYKTGI